jgi:mono/diheme cytochrome c family protein
MNSALIRKSSRFDQLCRFWTVLLSLAIATITMARAAEREEPSSIIIGPASSMVAGVDLGELLLNELNCVACHTANAAIQARLSSRKSPILSETGLGLTPQYLRAFLLDPQREKPGTTMPDLLHGLDLVQRAESAEALVHFLTSAIQTPDTAPTGADQFKIQQGRLLYHQVGCVACHAPHEPAEALRPKSAAATEDEPAKTSSADLKTLTLNSVPLGHLAKKTTVEQLARFLIDPLKARPSGRMPSLNLEEGEATAIAMYLLRDQANPANTATPPQRIQGVSYQYFQAQFGDSPNFDNLRVNASGFVDRFTTTARKRNNNYGFRYTGFIRIAVNGAYTFFTDSDDGSRLYIGDKLVVQNDGMHGAQERSGAIQLTAGEHPIMVTYFNGGGGGELKVSYQGPGLSKQEIPASVLSHIGQPMIPLESEKLTVDPEKAGRGKALFSSLGCAACHQISRTDIVSAITAKPLASLNSEQKDGCLGPDVRNGLPRFRLNESQRTALRTTLNHLEKFSQPFTAGERIKHTMAALSCLACHTRDGAGGPEAARAEYFTVLGEADLGDEGRIPPHLTRVGDKLRPEWLREVLLNKGKVRPYMAARMPQFGKANVEHLIADFEAADSPAKPESPSEYSARDAKFGRKLAGRDGLTCVSCHTFGKYKSLGIPAMDMTQMAKRLKKDWFHRYLLDPASLRPGTRMPTFWPEGKAANKEILDGDTDLQINALWTYLSKGAEADIPFGLVQAKLELAADKEAIIYRNFIAGAGSRAIGVAYPEKANLAFDANELRLALIWQGPFIDASRHRSDRGVGFEPPLGDHVTKMPSGPAFAVLPEASAPWPEATGKKGGYDMRGYRLDDKRRPAFLYSFQNIQIEDYPVARSGELDAELLRTLTFQSDKAVENLWFRAAVGSSITEKNGSYVVDAKMSLQFALSGGKPVIRQSNGRTELLVPVVFHGREAKIIETIIW